MTTSDFFCHFDRTRDAAVHSKTEWQWCPNPRCGRMACVVAGTGSVAVNCVCGWLWCSLCMQEVHWPASCEQAAGYRELVKNTSKLYEIPSHGLTQISLHPCYMDEHILHAWLQNSSWITRKKFKHLLIPNLGSSKYSINTSVKSKLF